MAWLRRGRTFPGLPALAGGNAVVAFQADDLDPGLRSGWTVTAVGHAARITDVDQLVEVSGMWLLPWAEGRREHFIRITPEKVSGRRLHPWSSGLQ